jgi:hypothetical protein
MSLGKLAVSISKEIAGFFQPMAENYRMSLSGPSAN